MDQDRGRAWVLAGERPSDRPELIAPLDRTTSTGPLADEADLRRRRLAGRPGGAVQARPEGGRLDGRRSAGPRRGPRGARRARPGGQALRALPGPEGPRPRRPRPPALSPDRFGDRADRRPPRPRAAGPPRPRGDLPLREAPRRVPEAPRDPDRRRGRRPAAALAAVLRPEACRRHRPGHPDRRDR